MLSELFLQDVWDGSGEAVCGRLAEGVWTTREEDLCRGRDQSADRKPRHVTGRLPETVVSCALCRTTKCEELCIVRG